MSVSFEVAGDVTSFNSSAFEAGLQSMLPSGAEVFLSVSAASVAVDARILLPSASAAATAVTQLSRPASELSSAIGVTVTVTTPPASAIEIIPAPSPPPPSQPPVPSPNSPAPSPPPPFPPLAFIGDPINLAQRTGGDSGTTDAAASSFFSTLSVELIIGAALVFAVVLLFALLTCYCFFSQRGRRVQVGDAAAPAAAPARMAPYKASPPKPRPPKKARKSTATVTPDPGVFDDLPRGGTPQKAAPGTPGTPLPVAPPLPPVERPEPKKLAIDDEFAKADKNGDGKLSRAEFMSYIAEKRAQVAPMAIPAGSVVPTPGDFATGGRVVNARSASASQPLGSGTTSRRFRMSQRSSIHPIGVQNLRGANVPDAAPRAIGGGRTATVMMETVIPNSMPEAGANSEVIYPTADMR